MTFPLVFAQADPMLPLTGSGSLVRGFLSILAVLALLGLFAWLLRRGTFSLPGTRRQSLVNVETAVPLGERRSLVVVSVEGRRLLLGLTPVQVSLVTELALKPDTFGQSLDRSLTSPRSQS